MNLSTNPLCWHNLLFTSAPKDTDDSGHCYRRRLSLNKQKSYLNSGKKGQNAKCLLQKMQIMVYV